MNRRHLLNKRALKFGLTLAGFSALAVPHPAAAQELLYTLSGVTFSDGATAAGYFVYDPTAGEFGAYDITTTNGLTDNLAGFEYQPGTAFIGGGNTSFQLATGDPYHSPGGDEQYLELITATSFPGADSPGTYLLQPGVFHQPGDPYPDGSAEFTEPVGAPQFTTTAARTISGGSLVVTNDSPIPEASTWTSFSLLLALGVGGRIVAGKRSKSSA